jgi:Fe-S cluster assembly protein SufD
VTPVAGGPVAAVLGPETAAARAAASPPWLAARRQAAWDAYTALPMPSSQRDEDWRRTDISGLHIDRFQPGEHVDAAVLEAMDQQRRLAAPDAAFAVDATGASPAIVDADTLLAQGVIVSTLHEAAVRHPELVQRALAAHTVDESKFAALWNAMWRGGVFVYVPQGVAARVPVWVAHASSEDGAAVFPALAVVLDDAASLTVVDAYASPQGAQAMFSNAVAALTAGRDAQLNYVSLQQWGEGAWHVATHRVTLGANARLHFFGATFGARVQKAYWEVNLDGTGSEADLAGVCFGDGEQHLDHQSLQAHRAPETRSDLLLKVAVRDKARSVYSGLIDVAPAAVHADGYVQNRNLLLSHGAKADSVPRLEIRANDVRCGHGATAGHIDDDQRFYFMTRAVPRAEADSLIVRGFMDDVVKRVPHEGVAELLGTLLDAEIAGQTVSGVSEGAG